MAGCLMQSFRQSVGECVWSWRRQSPTLAATLNRSSVAASVGWCEVGVGGGISAFFSLAAAFSFCRISCRLSSWVHRRCFRKLLVLKEAFFPVPPHNSDSLQSLQFTRVTSTALTSKYCQISLLRDIAPDANAAHPTNGYTTLGPTYTILLIIIIIQGRYL